MSVIDKIKREIEFQRLNITTLAGQLNVSRKTVYNLSDDNLSVTKLLQLSKILKKPFYSFFDEMELVGMVSEPNAEYGNNKFSATKELQLLKSSVVDKDKIIKLQQQKITELEQKCNKIDPSKKKHNA